MAQPEDKVLISLNDDEIKVAIQKAQKHFFKDNLRARHLNIQFDSKVRGFVGEIAIEKWLLQFDISFDAKNIINEDDSIDIDFLYKNQTIELKTSLIPDTDKTIDATIATRDIKLIKRQARIEDLRGDLHLQIFFEQRTKAKDKWLKQQRINLTSPDADYLFDAFLARAYRRSTYFVAWINKPALICTNNKLPGNLKTWSFAKREFWSCKITAGNKPADLIQYLRNL